MYCPGHVGCETQVRCNIGNAPSRNNRKTAAPWLHPCYELQLIISPSVWSRTVVTVLPEDPLVLRSSSSRRGLAMHVVIAVLSGFFCK